MARIRARRVADDLPTRAIRQHRWPGLRAGLADTLLWTLGGLGLLSLAAAGAAHVWGFSIVLFSTGSMAPTIPAGSAALVRLVPAAELKVGDVTTVQRPNALPITHRITSIEAAPGASSARVVTMRGDANVLEDPEPYLISDARVVVASMPGAADYFVNLRDPRLMGLLALVAGGLVTWAFWPRQSRKAAAVAAAVVVAGSPVLGATDAQAAVTEHQVEGRHLVLTVISDDTAMSSMRPHTPVSWEVGIATREEREGAVHIGLGLTETSVAADAIDVDVLACPQRWVGDTCPGDAESWVVATPMDQAFLPTTYEGTREFAVTDAGAPVWVQVRATLNRQERDVKATLKLAAWGGGEMVSAESDGGKGNGGGLAHTGADGTFGTLALAGAAIGTGLVVARLAGGRRRDTGREVVR